MAFEVTWYAPEHVLLLTISGHYSDDDARRANNIIVAVIERVGRPVAIAIDARRMFTPRNIRAIRDLQDFMDHRFTKHILIVAHDNLIAFSLLVLFSRSRAFLTRCNTLEAVEMLCG